MFEVGQKVLCIDDGPEPEGGPSTALSLRGVYSGNTYIVTETLVISSPFPSGEISEDGISLDRGVPGYYPARRFRPLDDPFIEQFRQMTRDCDALFNAE